MSFSICLDFIQYNLFYQRILKIFEICYARAFFAFIKLPGILMLCRNTVIETSSLSFRINVLQIAY